MRQAWIFHRYRKWKQKAFKAKDPLALHKWSYWHKLYGEHQNLWHSEPTS